jgi:hypothetical protein
MEKKGRKMSRNSFVEQELTWESVGDELFYHKDKFEFSEEEKILIKKLLRKSPPPLQYRRKVRIIYFIAIFSYG